MQEDEQDLILKEQLRDIMSKNKNSIKAKGGSPKIKKAKNAIRSGAGSVMSQPSLSQMANNFQQSPI